MTATTINGRIDRALHRMAAEGYQPRSITLGAAEQQAMADWLRDSFPTLPLDVTKTPAEQLAGMKYRAVPVICDDAPSCLKVEGVWLDPVIDGEPVLD